jgi:hypothetical protein
MVLKHLQQVPKKGHQRHFLDEPFGIVGWKNSFMKMLLDGMSF